MSHWLPVEGFDSRVILNSSPIATVIGLASAAPAPDTLRSNEKRTARNFIPDYFAGEKSVGNIGTDSTPFCSVSEPFFSDSALTLTHSGSDRNALKDSCNAWRSL